MKKELSYIGFSRQTADPTDKEVYDMVDDVIFQTLGAEGLRKIIKPGDKVVLKVNLVGPGMGARGEKGRGIITDPRVVRHVAGLVREIIGEGRGASLKVVDAVMYADPNPSLKQIRTSFYWARLERTGDNAIDKEDFCYDYEASGILDGGSHAQLVNLDSLGANDRQLFEIPMESGRKVKVSFPKFLRTKEQAKNSDTPHEYCDVFIGLPILKSHGMEGITGAIKLHYGIRSRFGMPGDPGRFGHSGMYYDEKGNHNQWMLTEYLCAQHKVRSYDYCIMDCITANRKGPTLPVGGISYLPTMDQTTDYIISSAMMASLDPVAIDTAEAALAGYELSSIPILETAAKNGLGQNDPALIRIEGNSHFSFHRQFLWEIYNEKQKYPLEDGWGGAKAMKTVTPTFSVTAATPIKKDENVYRINYKISQVSRKIVRVELVANGVVMAGNIGAYLEHGSFELDLNKFPELIGTDISYTVVAWDETFNCVASIERFILNQPHSE